MNPNKNKIINFFLVSMILIFGFFAVIYGVQAYQGAFKVFAELRAKNEVGPKDAVELEFSYPMMQKTVEDNLVIVPKQEVDFFWSESGRILKIIPKKNWQPKTEYQISFAEAKSAILVAVNGNFSFKTFSYPEIVSIFPTNGSKDILIDIEDPMRVVFDRGLRDFRVKFSISPQKKFSYNLKEEGDSIVELMPEGNLERGKKYSFEISIKHKDESDYHNISSSYFETLPNVPSEWDKDFSVRIDQAKKFTEPFFQEGKYIDINLKSQVMVLFENGKPLDAYLISSGKRGMETPQGTFKIQNKFPRPWSKEYRLYMPYWMAITPSGSHGIHELPEWPGGYKEGANHLGTPVSHGCVRLGVGSAKRVYEWSEIGMPVAVHY